MRTRLINEWKDGTAAAAPDSPGAIATILIIEINPSHVILNAHTSSGMLLKSSTHPSLATAKEIAARDFPGTFGEWQELPAEMRSVAQLLKARRLERWNAGATTLDYLRPDSLPKFWSDANFIKELLSRLALVLTFHLICLPIFPIGFYFLIEALDNRGTLEPYAWGIETALLATFLSVFSWPLPRIYRAATLMSLLAIAGTSIWGLIVIREILAAATCIIIPVAIVTSIPFFLLARRSWRSGWCGG